MILNCECAQGACEKYRFLPLTILMLWDPGICMVKSSAGLTSGVENFMKMGVVDRLMPAERMGPGR